MPSSDGGNPKRSAIPPSLVTHPDAPELTVIVPVYNERERIEEALVQILSADLGVASREIVIVDDGSTDGTSSILDQLDLPPDARCLRHGSNRGKGAAIRTGLRHARGRWSAIMDADLEYEPSDIARLIAPLREGRAEAVFGSRAFESHSAFSFWYVIGNKAVTLAANVLFNSWVSDIMTCHKVMPTEDFRTLSLREPGFAIEPEITGRLLRRGVRIYEVPISYAARSREEGKKLTALDGLRVLRTLLRCRLA
jgi:dolichol-phosphate hexosyltransferase